MTTTHEQFYTVEYLDTDVNVGKWNPVGKPFTKIGSARKYATYTATTQRVQTRLVLTMRTTRTSVVK